MRKYIRKEFLLKTVLTLVLFVAALVYMPEFGNVGKDINGVIAAKAVETATQVRYIDSAGAIKVTDDDITVTILNENTEPKEHDGKNEIVLNEGWYYIKESFDLDYPIYLLGDVHLILGDNTECNIGCNNSINLTNGIYGDVSDGDGPDLTIYSQSISINMGKLKIDSDNTGITVKDLIINGGIIISNGCNSDGSSYGVYARNFTINNGVTEYTGRDKGVYILDRLTVNGGRAWFRLINTIGNMHYSVHCEGNFCINGGQVEINGMHVTGTVSLNCTRSSDYILNMYPYYGVCVGGDKVSIGGSYGLGYGLYRSADTFTITFKYGERKVDVNAGVDETISESAILFDINDPNIEGWYHPTTREKFEFDKTKVTGPDTYVAKYYSELDPEKVVVYDLEYDGKAQDPVIKYDDELLYKDIEYTVVYKKGDKTLETAPIDAGEYTAVISGKGYYSGSFSKTFTVKKKNVSVSGITVKTKEYDGTCNAELDCSNVIIIGKAKNDVITVSANGTFADSDIGTDKTVSVNDVTLNGEKSGNYEIEQAENTLLGEITKRLLRIKLKDQTVVYGEKLSTESDKYEIVDGSLMDGHKIVSVFLTSNSSDVITDDGTIVLSSITIKNGDSDVRGFYNVRYVRGNVKYERIQGKMTVPEKKSLEYNSRFQELVTQGFSDDGDVLYALGQDDITAPENGFTDKVPEMKDAGDYYVWYKLVGKKPHTDIAAKCIKVSILPFEITVTSEDKSSKQGSDIVELTYKTDKVVFAGDDLNIVLSTEARKESAAGKYFIEISYNDSSNYLVNKVVGTYTIEEKEPDSNNNFEPEPSNNVKPEPTPEQNVNPDQPDKPETIDETGSENGSKNDENQSDNTSKITETKTDKNGTVSIVTVEKKEDNTEIKHVRTEFKNGNLTETETIKDAEGNHIYSSVEKVSTNRKGTVTSSRDVVNNNGERESSKKVETASGKITEKYYNLSGDGFGTYSVKTETGSGDKTSQLFVLEPSGKALLISSATTKKKAKIPEKITIEGKEYVVEKAEQTVVEKNIDSPKIKIDIQLTEILGEPIGIEMCFDSVPNAKMLEFWKNTLSQIKKFTVHITAKDKKEYKSLKRKFIKRLKKINANLKSFKFEMDIVFDQVT